MQSHPADLKNKELLDLLFSGIIILRSKASKFYNCINNNDM